ncbi:hypothetical protein GGS21DRAFT_493007 [Xylaria nigripes]|nr:hypothetical protein GGS21DRAFT_493007 [Xylaria nigripes]
MNGAVDATVSNSNGSLSAPTPDTVPDSTATVDVDTINDEYDEDDADAVSIPSSAPSTVVPLMAGANGNGIKKRKKDGPKPIITTEGQVSERPSATFPFSCNFRKQSQVSQSEAMVSKYLLNYSPLVGGFSEALRVKTSKCLCSPACVPSPPGLRCREVLEWRGQMATPLT